MNSHSAFWDDLTRDLEDRRFRQGYLRESLRIASVDLLVNTLPIGSPGDSHAQTDRLSWGGAGVREHELDLNSQGFRPGRALRSR